MIDDDLRDHFAAESEEHLDTIETLLAAGVADRAAIDSLFRAFHSLKGMSGALGGAGMMAVAHRCEDILGLARQGRAAIAGEAANALVAAVDTMRRQRAGLVGENCDIPAPAALLARLGAVADGTAVATPPPAAAPPPAPAPSAASQAARHFAVLAEVSAKVAMNLAPLAAGASHEATTLATELAALARAAGAGRVAATLDALPRRASPSALPAFGDLCRGLVALSALTGQDAGAAALQQALAETSGQAGLPARLGALADLLDGADPAACVAAARDGARIAAAIGEAPLEDLLLTVEDLWDRLAEPDAAAAVTARRALIAGRLRAVATGGLAALRTQAEEPTAPVAAPGIPPDFAATLGPEGAERAASAVATGRALYRARLGHLATVEREAALIEWLTAQGAEALASRLLPGSDPPVLELLLAGPADARAFEASRAAIDPSGTLVAALTPLGATPAGEPATPAAGGTLRLRQETVDGIIALEAEVRAAGLSLADVAGRTEVRGLATRIASLTRDLPPGRAAEAAALADRVSATMQEVQGTADRLTIALRRLNEAMMELRVTPLAALFGRMPRIARAVAEAAGKEIEVELAGGEVSIDRGLIEILADPLQHLVRNAVDHGVEPPAQRSAAGKLPRAHLRIAAERHGADRVRVTVADDGAGIDTEAVRRAAIARGVVGGAEAARLDETGVHRLLFRPGFSTKDRVSATSGRGVGLDVVEDAVHRAGGSVTVSSRPGAGTEFVLDLPLSAAMAPVLLVEAGGHPYALPVARVEAVLHTGTLGSAGELPPVVSLEAALGLPVPGEPGGILLLRGAGGRRIGLSVGRVSRRVDLLLRPLHPTLAALPGVGGVGVLGTGEPVVVLEPDGLVPA